MKSEVNPEENAHHSDLIGKSLSPFRYPGGKSWFMDHVRRWLRAQIQKPKVLVEPFAGGAGVSLISVREKLVQRAVFAEIDLDVAATWETVLNGHATWLAG